MSHADHDLLGAVLAGERGDLVDHRHGHVEALDREHLLAEVGLLQEALELEDLDQPAQQAPLLVGRERRAVPAGLDHLPQPHALREMIETGWHRSPLSADEKRSLLRRLIEVFQFERFLQKAYLGQKMFSIEGLDVTVPMLDEIATLARQNGAEEVADRHGASRPARPSSPHNLGRSVESILAEFEGAKALDRVKAITGDAPLRHRRRQVPPRRRGPVQLQRRPGEGPPVSEPEPPRVRRPGGHRRGARRPDRALPGPKLPPQPARGGAGAAARRRGLPGPGRGRRRCSTCSRCPATRRAAPST